LRGLRFAENGGLYSTAYRMSKPPARIYRMDTVKAWIKMHESAQLKLQDRLDVIVQMLECHYRLAACRHYLFLTQNVVKVVALDIRLGDWVLIKNRPLNAKC
jgi:hypothetical protein